MRKAHQGMSLIELMTVVAIVALLGALAVSTYTQYSIRANRTEARTAILRIQTAEEKSYLQNSTYTTDFTSAPPTGLGVMGSATTSNGFYTITLAAGATGTIATSFLVTATATAGQTRDVAACQTFTIDDQGARTPADSTGCWK